MCLIDEKGFHKSLWVGARGENLSIQSCVQFMSPKKVEFDPYFGR